MLAKTLSTRTVQNTFAYEKYFLDFFAGDVNCIVLTYLSTDDKGAVMFSPSIGNKRYPSVKLNINMFHYFLNCIYISECINDIL